MTPSVYHTDKVAHFRFTNAKFGIFSNMHTKSPIRVNGHLVPDTEAYYQVMKHTGNPQRQREILEAPNPMAGKAIATNRAFPPRADWDDIRVIVMRHALMLKLMHNREAVISELRDTKRMPIVEYSKRDAFWGAVPQPDDTLVGANVLGKLWMEIRHQLNKNPDFCKDFVPAPPESVIRDYDFLGERVRDAVFEADKTVSMLDL